MRENCGINFQENTRYSRRAGMGAHHKPKKPEPGKTYPGAKKMKLPYPKADETLNLHALLRARRSVRSYDHEYIMELRHLACLLWAASGVREEAAGKRLRMAPSAGALYPLETYVVANRVEMLTPGIYHYLPEEHALELVKPGLFADDAKQASLGVPMLSACSAVVVWSAVFDRTRSRYSERAFRYIYLDCGHAAQNLALEAVNLGLSSCQIGSYFDDEWDTLLGLEPQSESVIYLSVAGKEKA